MRESENLADSLSTHAGRMQLEWKTLRLYAGLMPHWHSLGIDMKIPGKTSLNLLESYKTRQSIYFSQICRKQLHLRIYDGKCGGDACLSDQNFVQVGMRCLLVHASMVQDVVGREIGPAIVGDSERFLPGKQSILDDLHRNKMLPVYGRWRTFSTKFQGKPM